MWSHCIVSHRIVCGGLKGTLSTSKCDFWALMLFTIANGACSSGTEIEKEIRTGDRQMSRTRERGEPGEVI